MSLRIQGTVGAVVNRKRGKDHKDAGQVYARVYQVDDVLESGYRKTTDVDDWDLEKKVEVGQKVDFPIIAEIYIPVDKNGVQKGEPRIQYRCIGNGNSKNVEPEKKGVKV